MIEAELFDGTVLEFPPGTPLDVVQRVAREQTAARRTAAQPQANVPTPGQGGFSLAPGSVPAAPPERSWMDAITGGATQAIAGVREGASNLLGLPVDIVNNAPRVLNLLPGVDGVGNTQQIARQAISRVTGAPAPTDAPPPPVGGSDWIERNIFRAGGVVPEAPKPATGTERAIRRVGQEVGAAAIPVGGAIATGARVGVEGARKMNPIARMFVEPAAVAPGRFAQKEAAVALGAGAGASAVNELTDNINLQTGVYNPSTADLVGALGGAAGVGVAVQVGRPAITAGSAFFGRPKLIDDVVKEATVEEIIRAAGLRSVPGEVVDTTQFARQIEQGRRVGDTVPGFKESLADRTKNPGIAALEYGRQSGPNSGMFTGARDANTRAVNDALQATRPEGTPEATRQAVVAERDMRLAQSRQTLEQAQAQFDEAARALEPLNPNAEARGATIRSGVENAERAAREVERAAYEGFTGAADPAPLAEAFKRVSDNIPQAYRPLVAGVEDAIAIPGTAQGPLDLREVIALRSRLTTEQRNAASGPQPDSNKARVIGEFVDALDTATAQSLPGALLERWQSARNISLQVNERFNRPNDPVAAVLARREGRPNVPDSGVGQQFIRPDRGQASNVDRVLAETDLTSQGAPVFGALQDELRADALRRGVTQKPERADAFVRDYGTAVDRLGVRGEIEQVSQTGRAAQVAQSSDEALRRDLGTDTEPGRSVVGRFARYDASRADDALQEVLRDPQPAKAADDLLNFVGNKPEAVAGVQRVFWERMEGKARASGATTASTDGVQPWSPTRLKEFLDDPVNSAVAERLYRDNPEHLARIREIAEAVQGTNTKTTARAANSSGTAQALDQSNLPSAETIASRAFAVQRGQVGIPFTALNIAGIMARKATKRGQVRAINDLLDKALLDPDVAAALVKEYNPANRAALARKAKAWVGNQASTLIEMLDDDPDAEVKRAVTEGAGANR